MSTPVTPPVVQLQMRRVLIIVGLVGVLIFVLIGALLWNRPQAAAVDTLARYRVALKDEAQPLLDGLGSVPRYEISVSLNDELDRLTGSAQIVVPNNSPDPWTYLIFRLYPGLEQYGGLLSIQSVVVDGRTTTFSYQEGITAVRIDLPVALLSGQSVELYLAWTLDIPNWETDSAPAYRLFGRSQDMISLPLFYPALAVYEPGPTVATGRWWLEKGTSRGDASFNVTSLFVVTATLPADQIPVSSGTLITDTLITDTVSTDTESTGTESTGTESTDTVSTDTVITDTVITDTVQPENRHQYVWTTGPAREFLLHTSNRFQQASVEAYGTTVTSYWLPEYEAAGRAALQHTAAALRIFSDRFGRYPYRDLRVAIAPLSFRGMEYPQSLLLGVQLYDQYRNELEIRAVHEVAHQWWYQLVHNDPVNQPWMDEGLAEYSSKIYYEAMRGADAAAILQAQRWQAVIDLLVGRGADEPLAQPVMAYADGGVYESVVYGKGALFFDAVRQSLGERTFDEFLRAYVKEYTFKIVTPPDLYRVLRGINPQVADSLYRTWIGEPPSIDDAAEDSGPTTDDGGS